MSLDFIKTAAASLYDTLVNSFTFRYVRWEPKPNEPQTYAEASSELIKAVGNIASQILKHPKFLLCCGLALTGRAISHVDAVRFECDQTERCTTFVKVAIVDCGFNLKHPEFLRNPHRFEIIDPKYPCTDGDQTDVIGCAFFPNFTFPILLNNTYESLSVEMDKDLGYHGTITSSTIYLETPDQASILPIICPDIEKLPEAIRFAKQQGADVISISLAFGVEPSYHKDGFDYFSEENIAETNRKKALVAEEVHSFPGPIFISAGNHHLRIDDRELPNWGRRILLANIPNIYYIAAAEKVGNQWKISTRSNFGKAVDFASPVPDTIFLPCEVESNQCYGYVSSYTSYAVPEVAATYALMLLEDPSLTVKKAMMIIKNTGDLLSDREEKGVPYVINRLKAIEKIKKGVSQKTKMLNALKAP